MLPVRDSFRFSPLTFQVSSVSALTWVLKSKIGRICIWKMQGRFSTFSLLVEGRSIGGFCGVATAAVSVVLKKSVPAAFRVPLCLCSASHPNTLALLEPSTSTLWQPSPPRRSCGLKLRNWKSQRALMVGTHSACFVCPSFLGHTFVLAP